MGPHPLGPITEQALDFSLCGMLEHVCLVAVTPEEPVTRPNVSFLIAEGATCLPLPLSTAPYPAWGR
jgi:hypothetical protein